MNESELLKAVLYKSSQNGAVLFRNQVGKYRLEDGRFLSSGLCVGSSDLIGWTTIKITQEMVGKSVAAFTAIECKSEKGRVSKEQNNFLAMVHDAGGIARIVRSMNGLRFNLTGARE